MKLLTVPIAALALGTLLGAAAPGLHAQSMSRPTASRSLPEAGPEQIQAAQYAHVGSYQCEFNQSITVSPSTRHEGYVDVRYQNQVMTMKPVLTSTGTLRMEDVLGQRLLLQIANKSMLMDIKAGKRLVDNCVHAAQRSIAHVPAGILN